MKPNADVPADAGRSAAPMGGAPRRRGLLLGAGAAGAAVIAAKTLPLEPAAAPVASADKPDDAQGGYRLTAHIQRYYETTKA